MEIISQALGTALIFLLIPALHDFAAVVREFHFRMLVGIALFVLIEFTVTGYLVTTALASIFLRRRGKFVYPIVSAALYLVHSEIFFVAAGNRPLVKGNGNNAIQILGAVVAFVCALAGNKVLADQGWRELRTA